MDIQLGKNDVVNDMNRNIFEIDETMMQQESEQIDYEDNVPIAKDELEQLYIPLRDNRSSSYQ